MNKDEVIKLAQLAHIETTEKEAQNLLGDLSAILGYVSDIANSGVSLEKSEAGTLFNVLREDTHPHNTGEYSEALLEEVPLREGDFVKVKKIL